MGDARGGAVDECRARAHVSVMSRPALTSKRSHSVHSMPVAPALFFGAAMGSEKETKGSARLMKAFLYALRLAHARANHSVREARERLESRRAGGVGAWRGR